MQIHTISSQELSVYEHHVPFKIMPFSIFGDADGSLHLEWVHRPSKALLVEKIYDQGARKYLVSAAQYLAREKGFTVYVENYVAASLPEISFLMPFKSSKETPVDILLAFGGDGTLLHCSSLFKEMCPPILSFAMGSLGFLSPFLADNYKEDIDDLIRGYFYVNSRTRLVADIVRNGKVVKTFQALNDIVITPSVSASVCAIDSSIDGEYFTTITGDGLIIATSTGSTAYNLSAGGAMIHPSVSTILFTPICAHSLNTHPIVLPDCVSLSCKIASNDRTRKPYHVGYDSNETTLEVGDEIFVSIGGFPLQTVCKTSPVIDWLESISDVLKWNQPMKLAVSEETDDIMMSCKVD